MTRSLRVAMVRGHADLDAAGGDGVADYTHRLAGALGDEGLAVEDVPAGPRPRAILAAARHVAAIRPDVVHLQFAPSAYGFAPWTGLMLPDLLPRAVPLVTTLHEFGRFSTPAAVPASWWDRIERCGCRPRLDRETGRMIARSAAVLTTNDRHADALAERLGRRSEPAPLVPNVLPEGVSDRDATRAALGIASDATLVTFFGFLHPVKGLRYLIEAVATLRRAHPRLHLLLAGGHASRALPAPEAAAFVDDLRELAARLGVDDHLTITGHRPASEVSAALLASDIAAFPETGGTTTKSGSLLAAFAHGLPCVVTASPDGRADPELLDGRSVVVADRVRDADALVSALRRLLDDPGLRAEVADGACAVAGPRRWPALAATHHDLYRRLARRDR